MDTKCKAMKMLDFLEDKKYGNIGIFITFDTVLWSGIPKKNVTTPTSLKSCN